VVSILIPWRDRRELILALPSLIRQAQDIGGTVTVVNYGGSCSLLEAQTAEFASQIKIVQSGPKRFFNKAAAHNIGAGSTQSPYLFFCDCDIMLQESVLSDLVKIVERNPSSFATIAGVKETETNSRKAKHITCFGYELRLRAADGREAKIVDQEEDSEDGARHAPGLLLLKREHFLQVKGYNSRLDGWGWEDQDMICRLILGGGLQRHNSGRALHISHDDKARVDAYPYADRWESRDRMFRRALARYDEADFDGTYDLDMADFNQPETREE
jgi:GT2 family glycosyltransferase